MNLLKQKIKKISVGELIRELENVDKNTEVVLGFYRKDDGVHFGYLADVFTNMKYDSVIGAKLDTPVVELVCYQHEHTIVEKKDEL